MALLAIVSRACVCRGFMFTTRRWFDLCHACLDVRWGCLWVMIIGMTTGYEGLAYPPYEGAPGRYFQRVNEVLDYSVDFSGDLVDGDSIASSVWQSDVGLTLSNESHTSSATTVWVSGGDAWFVYNVVNTVTTTGGRVIAKRLVFTIKPLGL